MKNSFIAWRTVARLGGMGVLLLLGLQTISTSAHGVHERASDGHMAQPALHHHTHDRILCLHAVDGPGPEIHCHTVIAAARAIVPEWSPDPREPVPDDDDVAEIPRTAGPHLLSRRALPSAPPPFILFANFRS